MPSGPFARRIEDLDFAETYCRVCAAGWTRTFANGIKVIFCLLDREPVPKEMTDCDRFELREEEDSTAPLLKNRRP